MSRAELSTLMKSIFKDVQSMREAGQKEYARESDNAFANFERIGGLLHKTKEEILMVYLLKHMDGIVSWVEGHKSQRESVKGRIIDAITYLCLLYGMSMEDTLISPDAFEQAQQQCMGDEVI